jgi:predicted RNase H-like nuclease
MDRRYGVDGCRAGWFYFWINGRVFGHGVTSALAKIAAERTASVMLVDIPIGLPSEHGTRDCDTEARKLLGRRGASIFPAPCRAALDAESYEDACEVNERYTGRKLSLQCWNIVPKIREVDALLRGRGRARMRLRESHPELCFAALNGGRPMAAGKKSTAGFEERLAVLGRSWRPAERAAEQALAAYRRAEVARDDILDAMVLAVTASLPAGRRDTLPAKPRRDEKGLRMEMVRAVLPPKPTSKRAPNRSYNLDYKNNINY